MQLGGRQAQQALQGRKGSVTVLESRGLSTPAEEGAIDECCTDGSVSMRGRGGGRAAP
jgi:hypothetical protein